MPTQPTLEQAARHLRLDTYLTPELQDAIDQAHAETLAMLDCDALHEDAVALAAAVLLDAEHRGRVCTLDIIKAQLLLIDVGIGNNDDKAAERKQQAASNLLQRHRAMGV